MTIRELGTAIIDMPYGGNLVLVFVVLATVLPVIGSVARAHYMRKFDK